MKNIFLINPNTNPEVLDLMLSVASDHLPSDVTMTGAAAKLGPPMIIDERGLSAAKQEVLRLGQSVSQPVDAVIIGAFGDPGLTELRNLLSVPVIGLGEAAFRAAKRYNRPFGVATTTPGLLDSMQSTICRLELQNLCTGIRTPEVDPLRLAEDPKKQEEALLAMTLQCIEKDHAHCVIIGGGPFSKSAEIIKNKTDCKIINPLLEALNEAMGVLRRAEVEMKPFV